MASAVPAPSAEDQLAFLAKLQRLFSEGDFTATYKFALIMALADLALEQGADDGAPLPLATRQLAIRFIELYWNQVSPYGSGRAGTRPGVLSQNLGKQAAVVSAIEEFRQSTGETRLGNLKTLPGFDALKITAFFKPFAHFPDLSVGPRPDRQGQHGDRNQPGPGETQSRAK